MNIPSCVAPPSHRTFPYPAFEFCRRGYCGKACSPIRDTDGIIKYLKHSVKFPNLAMTCIKEIVALALYRMYGCTVPDFQAIMLPKIQAPTHWVEISGSRMRMRCTNSDAHYSDSCSGLDARLIDNCPQWHVATVYDSTFKCPDKQTADYIRANIFNEMKPTPYTLYYKGVEIRGLGALFAVAYFINDTECMGNSCQNISINDDGTVTKIDADCALFWEYHEEPYMFGAHNSTQCIHSLPYTVKQEFDAVFNRILATPHSIFRALIDKLETRLISNSQTNILLFLIYTRLDQLRKIHQGYKPKTIYTKCQPCIFYEYNKRYTWNLTAEFHSTRIHTDNYRRSIRPHERIEVNAIVCLSVKLYSW